MKLALIGKELSHSFSQNYFNSKFQKAGENHSYENLEFISEEYLIEAWPQLKIKYSGFNVTIPYKKTILALLDEIDSHANQIAAVNCIAIKDGQAFGYNTDYLGFYESVNKKSFAKDRKALILGNGGASHAVKYAIDKYLSMPLDIMSRDASLNVWNDLEYLDLSAYSLIVNATPIGMYPLLDDFPRLNYSTALHDTLFVDLIYNPIITKYLEKADAQGCIILNGLPMLHRQAELSWEIWKEKNFLKY